MEVPSQEAIRAQLNRILESVEFRGAGRMRRFLELVVEETLRGRGESLKEYPIGIAVFDRPANFDPSADPIVRVEARRLRAKLENFYAGAGHGDDVIIEIPKGQYAPRIRTSGPTVERNSIAVLPFEALGGGEERYFADGLTWELIHQLTRVEGLSVVAWNSAEQTRGMGGAWAAGKLNASTVLAGSVRRAGQRLRIVVQLVDVSNNVYLWSETFDRTLDDILEIQDEIARAIVARLGEKLGLASAAPRPRMGYNIEAYGHYLEGRAHAAERTPEGLTRSIECFRRALQVDEQFALAHAGLAEGFVLLADYGLEPVRSVVPAAKAAASRALEIEPGLGEAHCTLGFLLALHDWKWAEGEAHFRRALELNPSYSTAHHWLGADVLGHVGRFDEALREIDIARQLDPLSGIVHEGRGYVLMMARRYEEALEFQRSLVERFPSFFKAHTTLGRILFNMGRHEEAIQYLENGRALAGSVPSILGALAQTHGAAGNKGAARELLEELKRLAEQRHVAKTTLAVAYLGAGDRDTALTLLERAASEREIGACGLKVNPIFDPLRGYARFEALLERVGFPD
ncbi:MAG: tetratricopeptide repeat protein [Bryobacterales bacterium]|nr:tetratricopeptide repeat protein [Bryobacterales bacterium]